MHGLVEHHTHYKEIHGFDKTVWLSRSEHQILHYRLRAEGKCNIPSDKLYEISRSAGRRTQKAKIRAKNIKSIRFDTPMIPYIQLREQIKYNEYTGFVGVYSTFEPTNRKNIVWIDIK